MSDTDRPRLLVRNRRHLTIRPLPTVFLAASWIVAMFGSAGAEGRAEPDAVDPGRPNIVLIVVDTLRKDHLGTYGYKRQTSPHLDRLANDSLVFDRALSQAPWTTPSIGSLLTSRYPSTLGITGNTAILSREEVLLSEVLADSGYRTGAVVSHSFCSSRWNFDQGFQEFDESNAQGHGAITSESVTDRALEFLAKSGQRPFFLWLHYFDPHVAFHEHPDFPFANEGRDYNGPISSGILLRRMQSLQKHLTPEDIAELNRLYDSEIAFTDRAIGRFLDKLRSEGLYEDAIIIFTADHGEEFMDHGRIGHAATLYQELINVPLFIKLPGHPHQRIDGGVGLIDLYPTLLEFVKIDLASDLQGKSLLALIGNDAKGARAVFSETSRSGHLRSIVVDGKKLILDLGTGERKLYELSSDPREMENIIESNPALAEALTKSLHDWIEQTRSHRRSKARRELSREEIGQLEALGYLE